MRCLLLLFLSCTGLCYAQNQVMERSILNFHQFTPGEGLSESNNWFLYMDTDRFTWIGSEGGPNYFDGVNNRTSFDSLQGINIQSPFLEDGRGDIWFTTREAIHCYQKDKGRLTYDFADENSLSGRGMHYAFHLERDSFLWVISQKKLFKYNIRATPGNRSNIIADTFQVIRAVVDTTPAGNVEAVYGCYWSYAPGMGFEVIEFNPNGESNKYTWADIRRSAAEQLTTFQVLALGEAVACFLTDKGLLFLDRKDPSAYTLEPFPADLGQATSMIKMGDNLWLANGSEKIFQFDHRADHRTFSPKVITAYNLDTKSPLTGIEHIFHGRDSIFWVSVPHEGVFFANLYNTRTFSVLGQNTLEDTPIRSLFDDAAGNLWGVSAKLEEDSTHKAWSFDRQNRLQKTSFLPFGFKAVLLNNGTVWAISSLGIGQQNKTDHKFKWTVRFPELQDNAPLDLVPFGAEKMLIGTYKGVYLYNTSTGKLHKLKGFDDWGYRIFVDTQDRLWVDNLEEKISIWQIDEARGSLHLLDDLQGVKQLNLMVQDTNRGLFWLATPLGLLKLAGSPGNWERTLINRKHGFPNDFIRSVVLDKNGKLWLATNGGIIWFDPDALPSSSITHFTDRDGLSTMEYASGMALMTRVGKLCFASSNGIDTFDPAIRPIAAEPKLAIRSLFINNDIRNEWRDGRGRTIADQEGIELSHQQNTLTFDLSALEYSDPSRNRIKVYLISSSGVDSSLVGPDNRFTYTDLEPGGYIFEFSASNAEGRWTPPGHPYRLNIKIHPPWYQTSWFMILSGLIVITAVGLLTSFYYQFQLNANELELEKERQERAREKALQVERNRIGDIMHDDINGSLSTISNISKRMLLKIQPPADWKEKLTMISERSTKLIRRIDDVIWALDLTHDSLRDLVARIRSHTAEFLAHNEIAATLYTPDYLPDLTVTSKARHNINLTTKEILHNILKHSKATRVNFDLSVTDSLLISIADNGIGFDINSLNLETAAGGRRKRGLGNCIDRIKSINGQINWTQPVSGGTLVTIEVNFKDLV